MHLNKGKHLLHTVAFSAAFSPLGVDFRACNVRRLRVKSGEPPSGDVCKPWCLTSGPPPPRSLRSMSDCDVLRTLRNFGNFVRNRFSKKLHEMELLWYLPVHIIYNLPIIKLKGWFWCKILKILIWITYSLQTSVTATFAVCCIGLLIEWRAKYFHWNLIISNCTMMPVRISEFERCLLLFLTL